ncbi:MAG TPA: acetate--CoA ligase family protein [Burkholderiales bacterium]|nr:acetate--CoA ligase family protein [Burkholderiales bacterium]
MSPALSKIFGAARATRRAVLDEPAAKRVLAAYGLAVPPGVTVRPGELPALAGLSGPFAAKLISPDASHKSDVGGVRLGLPDAAAVATAVREIEVLARARGLTLDGVLVEEMAPPGVELVIGGLIDARFGPVVMLGLGGVFIEIFGDTAFRVCPIDRRDALEMIDELRGAPLLRGARGRAPVDEARIVQALLSVGGAQGLLLDAADEIAELDINPLIVSATTAVACDARIVLSRDKQAARPGIGAADAYETFRPIFRPRVVAVVGASASGGVSFGNEFIRHSRSLGYDGRLVPIHPSATTVEGLPAAKSFEEVGEPVDLAYIAVGAPQVPALIASAGGKVRFAQVTSSGFGELAEGRERERELVEAARAAGVRIIGPNCLGVYSPRGKITFIGGTSAEPGEVGVITQSGGLGVDILLRGQSRGLRYSGLVTIGNSADIGPAELLEYFLADPETRVIGLYAEDIKDGRAFFRALREARGAKPVVVLLGGQTSQGRHAAASHTGSLASAAEIWRGLATQAGIALTRTLDEFLDVLLGFQALSPRHTRPTKRCVLFGNGGGTSVLAADAFGRKGLEVSAMPKPAIDALTALALPPGTSVVNPIDAPAPTLRQEEGRIAERILDIVLDSGEPDALVMHINLPVFIKSTDQRADFMQNLIDAAIRARSRRPEQAHFVLVLRSDGAEPSERRRREFRELAVRQGIPVYDEMANAADALAAMASFEHYRGTRR